MSAQDAVDENLNNYSITTNKELAETLKTKPSKISFYAHYLPDKKKYKTHTISKRGGGARLIDAPNKNLKIIQRSIANFLNEQYKARACVFAYVQNRGIVGHGEVHTNQRWLLRLDIKDFFHSITTARLTGLLVAAPFFIAPNVARTISLLCTKDGRLPQGSPASPTISNIICRGLDYKLKTIASKNKCYYTRYADDIFLSNNGAIFPPFLAQKNDKGIVTIGVELSEIITSAGFSINEEKTFLRSRGERQIVTGLVVNKKVNVPKEFIRNIKSALHSWRKFGFEAAQKYWRDKVDKRNRWLGEEADYKLSVRGQINHVGFVKGYSDPVYLSLARKLSELDSTFIFDESALTNSIAEEIHVFCEGETDVLHLKHAFQKLKDEYPTLNLTFKLPNIGKGDGSSVLKNFCNSVRTIPQKHLTICLFDRDEPTIIREMAGSALPYRDFGSNIFSLVIPSPDFRDQESICIEHLYKNDDLLKKDSQGRRLYLNEEFDSNSRFTGGELLFKKTPKSTLILEADIIDFNTGENVALSKSKFANYVYNETPPFTSIDITGFRVVFDQIAIIREAYFSVAHNNKKT